MAGKTARSGVGRTTTADYLKLFAIIVYALAGVVFSVGLVADWMMPGQILIPLFAMAPEPNANSGLFILSILILITGYLLSKTGDKLEEWQTEKVDQTQEWTVDVGESSDK